MPDASYRIRGAEMQFVELDLPPGQAAVGEAGSLFFLQPGISLETVFGDGSKPAAGMLEKMFDAGKRALSGASVFTTVYANQTSSTRVVAFAAPYPGKIVALDLANMGGALICHRDAFLCAQRGAHISIAFQKRLGAGFFGGDGFVMQRIESPGTIFFHGGGMLIEHQLAAGETIRAESGSVVAYEPSVDFDIEYAGSIKTALFGGQGLFLATLRGPGRIWLQSMPFSKLASRVFAAAPQTAGAHGSRPDVTDVGVIGSVVGGLFGMVAAASDD
ncbi:MAG: AIM24 family protein [Pseudomonadota bacterium]|nr:AIM24 family protein [Pseudomonadota bacterium]